MRVCSLADQIFNIYKKKSNELTNFFKKHQFLRIVVIILLFLFKTTIEGN